MKTDHSAAFRGILNALTLSVIAWALLVALLFYGFRITL